MSTGRRQIKRHLVAAFLGFAVAGVGVIRLQVRFSSAAGDSTTSIDIANKDGVASGDTKRYQIWYRDPAASPCGALFNLSNGLEVTYTP